MTRRTTAAVVATACLACLPLAACSDESQPQPSPSATTPGPDLVQAKRERASLIFGQTNAFRLDISRAAVAVTSPRQIAHLMAQITPNWGGVVTFNAHQYNSALWVADATTPLQRIDFDNCQKKTGTPANLYDGQKFFVDVPVPAAAAAANGTDAAMTVWSPSKDALWELWVATKKPNGHWSACWGGRIDHVSSASRGAFPAPYGASASGLSTVGSMVTIAEARALKIEHAMQIGLMYLAAGRALYPANRSDGLDVDPAAIPVGTRLRLPASVNVDALDLPPLGKAIARAAQKYGFMVTETSGAVAVGAESGKPYMVGGRPDPWDAILGATDDRAVLATFPWAKLQVVDPGIGAPTFAERVVTRW